MPLSLSSVDRRVPEALSTSREWNKLDQQIIAKYFAPEFEHIGNGSRTNLTGYSEHLAEYMLEYKGFRIPNWDELFSAGDKVVTSYTLEGETVTGKQDRSVVIAIWRLANGKVVSLREVDARPADVAQAGGKMAGQASR